MCDDSVTTTKLACAGCRHVAAKARIVASGMPPGAARGKSLLKCMSARSMRRLARRWSLGCPSIHRRVRVNAAASPASWFRAVLLCTCTEAEAPSARLSRRLVLKMASEVTTSNRTMVPHPALSAGLSTWSRKLSSTAICSVLATTQPGAGEPREQ